MKRTFVLIVLDGWGIGRTDYSNPLFIGKPKTIEYIKTHYLSAALQSSGIAVGLPWDEEGNSEVGHLTIGAGKILYQHYPRIMLSIQRGDFFKNKAFTEACEHVKKTGGDVNLAGLLTEGNVHASIDHLKALIKLVKQSGCEKLNLHLFTDGKDSPPKSALTLIARVNAIIKDVGVGKIATIAGRYYALDRDGHWDRTSKTYDAMTGRGSAENGIEEKINSYYKKGLSDEFIEPFMVGPEPHPVKDGDALIFFDFREDSIRQIAGSFIIGDNENFPTVPFSNLYIATMTHYSDRFNTPAAFPNERIEMPLGKVISDHGLVQLRVAETEKYAHVTFFFNGYQEKPFPNEYRILIPSKNVARHDEAPEMMAKEIGVRITEALTDGGFDFILANFANPDMVAHTGNFDASLQAVMSVDREIEGLLKVCLEKDAPLIITSDHGNVERLLDPFTGRPETKHDPNLVPFYLVGKAFGREKNANLVEKIENEAVGILSDVAPTILELMGLPKPEEMTGQSLLKILR